MNKTYTLASLEDIYHQIPTNKVDECLAELAMLIKQTQKDNQLFSTLASLNGIDERNPIVWPKSIDWIDDGKGNIIVNYHPTNE